MRWMIAQPQGSHGCSFEYFQVVVQDSSTMTSIFQVDFQIFPEMSSLQGRFLHSASVNIAIHHGSIDPARVGKRGSSDFGGAVCSSENGGTPSSLDGFCERENRNLKWKITMGTPIYATSVFGA